MDKKEVSKSAALPDRKNAPKRTGKPGIKPLDEKEDFEKPVKKEPEAKVIEKGSSLLVEQPKKAKVVGKRFEATFLKPTFSLTTKGDKMVAFRMTLPLEKEHDDVLPKLIAARHKDSLKKGCAGTRLKDVPAQKVDFYLSQDIKDPILTIPEAKILGGRIDIVQRKGEGESRQVVRLTFMPQVKVSQAVERFAANNFGNTFWLELTEVEPDLLNLDDEDDEE